MMPLWFFRGAARDAENPDVSAERTFAHQPSGSFSASFLRVLGTFTECAGLLRRTDMLRPVPGTRKVLSQVSGCLLICSLTKHLRPYCTPSPNDSLSLKLQVLDLCSWGRCAVL